MDSSFLIDMIHILQTLYVAVGNDWTGNALTNQFDGRQGDRLTTLVLRAAVNGDERHSATFQLLAQIHSLTERNNKSFYLVSKI